MNAPRALPIVSGPVGLAETNSTLTRRGRGDVTVPQASGSARMPSTIAARASGRSRRFTNPGGATSAASIGESWSPASRTSLAASTVAISSGAFLYGLASFIARFDARSPCSGFRGSIDVDGRSGRVIGQRRERAGLDRRSPRALDRLADLAAQWCGDQGSVEPPRGAPGVGAVAHRTGAVLVRGYGVRRGPFVALPQRVSPTAGGGWGSGVVATLPQVLDPAGPTCEYRVLI